MSARTLFWLAVGLSLAPAAAPAADKLSKEDKKWLEEEVAPIILPAEERAFKDLKSGDRAEFQHIFWARRDPNPDLEAVKPDNAFKAEYYELKAKADERFKGMGRPGSLTDCGRVFLILGEPDDVREEGRPEGLVRRSPETWTYKDKPDTGVKFTGGQMQVGLDENCQLPPGSNRFREQLVRLAEVRIIRPDLDYKAGKDGRLVKLIDQLPKPSPARTLLKEGRKDFTIATEDHYLKVADGGTALVGLVEGDAAGMSVQEGAAGQTVKLTVTALASDADGKATATYEQATTAPVKDGRFLASYRLGLKPGKYAVRAGAIELSSAKGAVVDRPVEVPDFNTGELSATLIITGDMEENVTLDLTHPFAAFQLGNSRIIPRFGGAFTTKDSVYFFYQYYDARVDEQTGKASVVATVTMKRGDKPVARAGDVPFDAAVGGTVVGPVPLEKYEPGSYRVELKVTDNITKKTIDQAVAFELK
jgi:GWxTD domain-containing protein